MGRHGQPRRTRVRTKPTTNGPLPLPGSADPRRHLDRVEYDMQLQDPSTRVPFGHPIGVVEYEDHDLGRRLQRRGWEQVGDTASSWAYPDSLIVDNHEDTEDVKKAAAQWQQEQQAYMTAMLDWTRRAKDSGAQGPDEAAALVGPEPQMPPLPVENADTTFISTGEDGMSYSVLSAGFDSSSERHAYTDRHQLLLDLDKIESWRFTGPKSRVIPK